MSACVIVALGFADGRECPHEDKYLEAFDFDKFDGAGYGEFTAEKGKAKRFANPGEALAFWKRESVVRPLRRDGRPNRPLSCLNIGIEHVE